MTPTPTLLLFCWFPLSVGIILFLAQAAYFFRAEADRARNTQE